MHWLLERIFERQNPSKAGHLWGRRKMKNGKFIPFARLDALCRKLRSEGKTIVTTNGVFDLLHVGHVRYLKSAKALGDILIVGVNSDRSARALKGGNRPIVPEMERAEVLCGLEDVDYVCIFGGNLPSELIAKARPAFHVKGGDYSPSSLPETPLVRKYGGQVRIVPFNKGHSTTSLIRKISKTSPK